MKNRIISLMLTVALTLITASCGVVSPAVSEHENTATDNSAANETVIRLVMAEVNGPDSIAGMTDQKFVDEVDERSNGSIDIDLMSSGVMGSENDVLDTMFGGAETVDISRISAFGLANYGGEKSKIFSLPYLFTSHEHFWNFADSDLAQEFLGELSNNKDGVKGLFYGEEGFRHFFTTKEISDISSLKGKKLRVSNDPIMTGLVECLGAAPTIISFGELYSALQTGAVDGAEQPISNYKTNAFDEVAKNVILDGHTLGIMEIVITDAAWNKLSPEQQTILIEAGKAASEYNRSISEGKEQEVLSKLKEEGINIIEIDDITPWQEAAKPVIDKNINGLEDYYEMISDMK